jgi:DNA-binding transcriptional regulator YiaG
VNEDEVQESKDARAIRSLLECLEAHRAEWFLPVFLMLVRHGLHSLRAYLEDPNETVITWGHPVVELHWPVEWDWKRWEEEGRVWAGPEPEDLLRLAAAGGADKVVDALLDFVALNVLQALASWRELKNGDGGFFGYDLQDGRLRPLLPEGLEDELGLKALSEQELGEVLAELYCPFTFDRKGLNRLDPAFTETLASNLLRNLLAKQGETADEAEKSEDEGEAAESVYKAPDRDAQKALADIPADILDMLDDPLRFTIGLEDGRTIEVSVRLAVHAFVVDLDARKVYFPALVGLVLTESGEPADLSGLRDEDKALFWKTIDAVLDHYEGRRLAEVLEDLWKQSIWVMTVGSEESEDAEAQDATPATDGAVATLPAKEKESVPPRCYDVRVLLDGATRLDRNAAHLLGRMEKVTLPKRWGSVKQWEDLVQEERDRLLAEFGPAAFQATDQRGPLLVTKSAFIGPKVPGKPRERQDVVELTPEAEEGVLESLAGQPYRRLLKDDDGIMREYLVKRVRVAGGGTLEVRLTWYSMAWPLVDSAREDHRKALEAERARSEGTLFEMMEPGEQARLDAMLQHLQAIRDGRTVMEYVLGAFGRDGRNPVMIPAWELRTLLECEKDPNGLQRVRGCLRALQEVRYSMKAVGTGNPFRSWGPFLANVDYDPRGRGGHGDGVFFVQVAEPFVGCLKVFEANHRIRNARKVLVYQWSKDLTPEERKGLSYVRGFSALGAFYDRAKGFTDHQRRLRQWIEHELTLNKDGARKDREHLQDRRRNVPEAHEPRVYDSSFCPLLPAGKQFQGALGHFKHNAESGRKLYGSGSPGTATSGPTTEGLLSVLGYEVPSGPSGSKRGAVLRKALADLRAVVEEAMGGVVAVLHRKRWYSLPESVRSLPERDLGQEAKWFLFVAADWQERLHRDLEAHHKRRHTRGEMPYEVKVTTDREAHRQAHEALHGVRHEAEEPAQAQTAADAPAGLPLHHCLRAVRRERGLSQRDVGRLFGISKVTVLKWEAGPLPDEEGKVRGLPIPAELVPLVRRWIETGDSPIAEELAGRKTRRPGVSRLTGKPRKPKVQEPEADPPEGQR